MKNTRGSLQLIGGIPLFVWHEASHAAVAMHFGWRVRIVSLQEYRASHYTALGEVYADTPAGWDRPEDLRDVAAYQLAGLAFHRLVGDPGDGCEFDTALFEYTASKYHTLTGKAVTTAETLDAARALVGSTCGEVILTLARAFEVGKIYNTAAIDAILAGVTIPRKPAPEAPAPARDRTDDEPTDPEAATEQELSA